MKFTVAQLKANPKFVASRRGTGKTSLALSVGQFLQSKATTDEAVYSLEELVASMRQLGLNVAAYVPYDTSVVEADMGGISLLDYDENSIAIKEIVNLKKHLLEMNKT